MSLGDSASETSCPGARSLSLHGSPDGHGYASGLEAHLGSGLSQAERLRDGVPGTGRVEVAARFDPQHRTAVGQRAGLDEADVGRLELAVDEACANVRN